MSDDSDDVKITANCTDQAETHNLTSTNVEIYYYIAMARVEIKTIDTNKCIRLMRYVFPFKVHFESKESTRRVSTLQQAIRDAQQQCETDALHRSWSERQTKVLSSAWKHNYFADIVYWSIEKVP